MLLLPEDIDNYTTSFTTPEPEMLTRLSRETSMKTGRGEMLSGHMQGAFLQMISQAIKPLNILEIGTFTGYSAWCLVQGLQPGGVLHTVDIDEELQEIAGKYWAEAGISDRIIPLFGEAVDIIPTLDISFDLVFIDADKVNYERYYELVFDKLTPGGFILADNVLYDGEVLLPEAEQTKNARAMNAFNAMVKADTRVTHMLLPLRDGIMMVRKK